jgi:poly(A) polymerase
MPFQKHIQNSLFFAVQKASEEMNCRAFVIGGFVRDLVMKRMNKDVDIVTDGDSLILAQKTAHHLGVKKVTLFKNFGTAQFNYKKTEVEFVSARKESYRANSRKPEVSKGTLEDDQWRRDFTINALAISLQKENFGQLIDPFQGVEDINSKIIRTPLDPETTFSDDPLRMMRAVRFAAQLQFNLNENAFHAIQAMAYRLEIISMERIMVEFNKILLSKKPSVGLNLLFETNLLQQFFPEFVKLHGVEKRNGVAHKDNFYHTLEVIDNLRKTTDNLWLLWSAVLHDIAKPATKRFEPQLGWTFHGHEDLGAKWVPKLFARFKLPLDQTMKYVQKMVALHLRPIALTKEEISDAAIRRLLFEAGDDIDDLMLLCQADITSKNEHKVKKYLANYERVKEKLVELEEKDRIRNFQPPVSGELIMSTFKLQPCREVGEIKNAIKDAILDGIIENNFEQAFDFMLREAAKKGLSPA